MRLTKPESVLPNYTDGDLLDLGHVFETTTKSSKISRLRYDSIPRRDCIEWFRALCVHELALESTLPSISVKGTDDKGDVDRFEHLVVRDLDLAPVAFTNPSLQPTPSAGRIVAHIAFKYLSRSRDTPNPADHAGLVAKIPPVPPFPSSGNVPLQTKLARGVESTLASALSGVKCYEVREIATSSSHHRQGLAKELLQCLFTYADTDHLPVVLAATPAGYPLYRTCGFYEIGGSLGSVDIDLSAWGGIGLHQHVLMVRWPQGSEWEGTDWYEYREQHRTQ